MMFQAFFVILPTILALLSGHLTFADQSDNEAVLMPSGTCRQECAGFDIGCPQGFVCCRTGCGHICQKHHCPRIKLTPYPFCLTHCPFKGSPNKKLSSFCLCYNACMNVRCAKEEMCIPKQTKCEKEPCLPLGVCVNIVKYAEHGILNLLKDKTFSLASSSIPREQIPFNLPNTF